MDSSQKQKTENSNDQSKSKNDIRAGNKPRQTQKSWLDQNAPWILSNLKTRNSWKKFFKCWLASWISFILIIPHVSGQVLGSAGFFALLASIIMPINMPVQLSVFVLGTMAIGLLLGWAIGVAGMRASFAVRDQAILQAKLLALRSSLANSTDPNSQSAAIFSGMFLDTRSTVMVGAFLIIGTFFFGAVRAYAPKLTPFSIFGTIAVDVYLSFAPLFPSPNYTLLNSFLISLSTYIVISIVLSVLVFPETMNHAYLDGSIKVIAGLNAMIKKQDEILSADLSDLAPESPLICDIQAARNAVVAGINGLKASSGFINLEFRLGRWNGDDAKGLEQPLLELVARISGLQSFAFLAGSPQAPSPEEVANKSKKATVPNANTFDSHLLREIYQTNKAQESQHSLNIENMRPVIDDATGDLRRSCSEGLNKVVTTLSFVNEIRWRVDPEHDTKLTEELKHAQEQLEAAITDFKASKSKLLVEPYIAILRVAVTPESRNNLPLRSLYLAYAFSANLLVIAASVQKLIEQVRSTHSKRRTIRLWVPKSIRSLAKLFQDRHGGDDAQFGEDRQGLASETKLEETKYSRDPDSRPPTNFIQKFNERIYLVVKWTQSVEGVFTLKYVVLSLALWIPAVVPSSAEFNYVNKGLWALIMAQTTLNLYAGDMIYNLFVRILGTVIGLVFGLACWYIGNGDGPGNPYGFAASVAVFLVPVVWFRLYAPIQYLPGVLLTGVTTALIIGYSWIDTHQFSFGNPGYGWSLAWKRFALVIIGSAASAILMFFPPRSARKAVRKRNAAIISSIADTYAFIIETWIGSEKIGSRSSESKYSQEWLSEFRSRLVGLAEQITAVRSLTELARWEGNLRGKWPYEHYARLESVEQTMITGLAQLGGVLMHLDDEWRVKFLQSTNTLHPNFIGDVMSMFALTSQSLLTGEPMHQTLPQTLLDRLFYHRNATPLVNSNDDMHEIDEITSINFMFYAAGLIGAYSVLRGLDDLHAMTKDLCGEVPLRGFELWQHKHFEHHKNV